MTDGDLPKNLGGPNQGMDDELFLAATEAQYHAAAKPQDELSKKKMHNRLSQDLILNGRTKMPTNKWQKSMLAALVAVVIAFVVVRRNEDQGVETLTPKSIPSEYSPNPAKLSVFRVLPSMETEYVALLDLKNPEDIVLQAQSSRGGFITVFNWPKNGGKPRTILRSFSLIANEPVFLGSGEDIFIISKEEIEATEKICWVFGISEAAVKKNWSAVLEEDSKGGYDCLPTAL